MKPALKARIKRRLLLAGYARPQIKAGLTYAQEQDAATYDGALNLALTRILYTDAEIADGARWDGSK